MALLHVKESRRRAGGKGQSFLKTRWGQLYTGITFSMINTKNSWPMEKLKTVIPSKFSIPRLKGRAAGLFAPVLE